MRRLSVPVSVTVPVFLSVCRKMAHWGGEGREMGSQVSLFACFSTLLQHNLAVSEGWMDHGL